MINLNLQNEIIVVLGSVSSESLTIQPTADNCVMQQSGTCDMYLKVKQYFYVALRFIVIHNRKAYRQDTLNLQRKILVTEIKLIKSDCIKTTFL
jgi:hypothetical protein